MTIKELKEKLDQMTEDEFRDFISQFGGSAESPQSFVKDIYSHPEWEKWERNLCCILDIPTEDERRTQAAIRAGIGALFAAIAAVIAAAIALIALLVE